MTVKVSKPAINVREELADLRKPTGVAGEAMLRAETPQEQFNLIGAGRRNLLYNGDFMIAQRSTSSTTTQYSTVDRWKNNMPSRYTFSQSTDAPDGYSFSMKADCTATGNDTTTIFEQRLEGYDLVQTGFGTNSAKHLTLSFWIKSHQTGTFTAELYNPTGIDQQISKAYTVNNSGVWEYKTITYPPDTSHGFSSNSSIGLYLFMWFSAASSFKSGSLNSDAWSGASNPARVNSDIPNLSSSTDNYVQIAGVQLELGKVATPFEHRSYGEELALCQRFYYRVQSTEAFGLLSSCYVNSSTVAKANFEFPVPMRVAPTGIEQTGTAGDYLVNIAGSNTTCNAVPTYNNASVKIGQVNILVAGGLTAGHAGIFLGADSDGYIGFTGAEL